MTDRAVIIHEETGTATSLLERAARQEVSAWHKLVTLYGPIVYGWCRRWGLQASDAENVGQEVFLRVAAKLPELRRDRPGDSFRAWLLAIARNCYVDHLRKLDGAATGVGGSDAQARLTELAARVDQVSDLELSSSDEGALYRRLVEFIRSEFSDRDWTAFYRVVIDGLTPGEAAAELNVTVNVIYLARSRVLRRVRKEFAGLIPEGA